MNHQLLTKLMACGDDEDNQMDDDAGRIPTTSEPPIERKPAVKIDGATTDDPSSQQNHEGIKLDKDERGEDGVVKADGRDSASGVKRRKLRKMVARSGGYPSFRLLLSVNYDNSDDETPPDDVLPVRFEGIVSPPPVQENKKPSASPESLPKPKQLGTQRHPIYIDIDEELGLKPRTARDKETRKSAPSEYDASTSVPQHPIAPLSAADEGWYEGTVDMAQSPEDEIHLSDLHVWIRRQMEFFSATSQDVEQLQAGRRSRTVQGQVGVRCKHCASLRPPPTGAVSYPQNLGGIYVSCTQKPQIHFEQHCRNLPNDERERFADLMYLQSSTKRRPGRKTLNVEGKSVLPTNLYYLVSAKRLGLVEVEDGLRFGRDLNLELLPFETIRLQVDAEAHPTSSTKGALSPEPAMYVPSEPRITADVESEHVLAGAVMENDDPVSGLSRRHDKEKVTDYFFLIMRQAAICHATPVDFVGKGKKTKLMRVGFAGFCCRYCLDDPNVMPSGGGCRSFSSAADNLSSSISNSFSVHLQKCPKVPARIKKALLAYKRLHQRQLAQLPYGSQRRMIHDLWSRLRAADIPEQEMNERLQNMTLPASSMTNEVDSGVNTGENIESDTASTASISTPPQGRPESFPECQDAETLEVLNNALENWDTSENDHLLLPSDRWLISDYLFLVMRQLKVAFMDGPPGRRLSTTAGLRCLHCINSEQLVSPSGRAFPSAPDNFASSMNNSLYSHMVACPHVPPPIKRALVIVRRMHSAQCSSLKFGSQRRFFNMLHERLKGMQRPDVDEEEANPNLESAVNDVLPENAPAASESNRQSNDFSRLGFLEISHIPDRPPVFLCARCRMVPLQFRAKGSIFVDSIPSPEEMRDHSHRCVGDSLDLTTLLRLLKAFLSDSRLPLEAYQSESFAHLLRACVCGDPDLEQLLLHKTVQLLSHRSIDRDSQHSTVQKSTKGLWASFPAQVGSANVLEAFQHFAAEYRISSNLQDHPNLLKYILLIAPGLELPCQD